MSMIGRTISEIKLINSNNPLLKDIAIRELFLIQDFFDNTPILLSDTLGMNFGLG